MTTAQIKICYDAEFEGWVVSNDTEIGPDVFYGEIIAVCNTEAEARSFVTMYKRQHGISGSRTGLFGANTPSLILVKG
jgi:hypothetical protein